MNPLFYDAKAGSYWLKLDSGKFLALGAADAKLHLRHSGLRKDEFADGLNEIEKALYLAQVERHVDYAGPLAGHVPGLVELPGGQRILVTSGPELGKPDKDADYGFLGEFTVALLGEQAATFLHWLSVARQSLRKGDFRPGQLVVLAGPAGCGKSFLQHIVTLALGGRAAKPYRYMIGETAFNADLAGAEHLIIEDENPATDIRSRRKFGASVKDFAVNVTMSVHAKGRTAVTLPRFCRVTLSVNSEPENLMIVPPLDASLQDKLMLFRCSDASGILSEDRAENLRRVNAALPGFLWQLEHLRVNKKEKDQRFGVRAYHHPELLEILTEIEPHTRLERLIETVIADSKDGKEQREKTGDVFDGTAEELERRLRASAFSFAVERLLYYPSACGTYLATLARRSPERYQSRKLRGQTMWRISPGGEA